MSKLHAGLDVSDRSTAICVVDDAGLIVFEASVATTPDEIALALKPYRRVLEHVGQESGTKAAWLHQGLCRRRFPMVCLDARHAQAALAAKRNKTDKNDARGLALLLARGLYTTAHIKSAASQRLHFLLIVRKALQRKALDLQTFMQMSAKTLGVPLESRRRRTKLVSKRGQDPLQASLFEATYRASTGLMHEVKALDKIVLQAARADPICRRLMTIPGVGPITALTFRASVDDPFRFKTSRDVAAYFGLTARRFQSGQTDVSGHITRWGDPSVRAVLYEAACSLLNTCKSQPALRRWGLDLVRRKGFKVAAVACARKLACLMHRMWVTERDFQPDA